MTTGIQSGGVDLDSLLMPIGAHAPIANVHITSNGSVDLSQRFAGAAFGTPYGTTNIQSSGADIGTLFARIVSGPTTLTLTAVHFNPVGGVDEYGFIPGHGGSVSPTTFDGYTVLSLFSSDNGVAAADEFSLSAASDPGVGLFTTLAVSGGGTRTSATAVYSFSGGVALWHWNEPTGGGLFTHTGTFSVTLS
jgi:hypothetical protein